MIAITEHASTTSHNLVLTFHQNWAFVVLLYSLFLAIWGLFQYLVGRNPSGGYLGALIIAEGVAILQGIVGLALLIGGHRPHDALHYLYGVVAVLTLPTVYFSPWLSGGTERRDSLVLGIAMLFLFGIAIRGITTGAGT
jgi:hypothetical protein